jgi:phage repressor protein C with HTH and peptisase S24 domain
MSVDQKIAARLKEARIAAGYASANKAAEAMGVKAPGYAHHENGTRGLARGADVRYARFFRVNVEWLLTGFGPMRKAGELVKPPEPEPVEIVTNVDLTNIREVPRTLSMPLDVPVLGTAVGGNGGDFSLNGDVVDRVRRPPGLIGNKGAFAVYVVGDSMEPRHYQGDLLYVDPRRPARSGDDVLIELKPLRPGEPGHAMVKQLVVQTPLRVVVRQFNPAKEVTIAGDKVLRVSLILKLADLLGV